MKKAIKIVAIVAVVVIVLAGAFWAKGYYNDRYVTYDYYYTQIPLDEVNEDSWLLDDEGNPFTEGKTYELVGYNEKGEKRNVGFFARGSAEDYYDPGAYIKVEVSKTIELSETVVQENEVPEKALEIIKANGTKK